MPRADKSSYTEKQKRQTKYVSGRPMEGRVWSAVSKKAASRKISLARRKSAKKTSRRAAAH